MSLLVKRQVLQGGRKRRCVPDARIFRLCNMTRYGDKFRRHVLESDKVDGIIAVETHLDRQRSEHETQYWGRLGWSAQFAPGQFDESVDDANDNEQGRPQGGAVMMTRSQLKIVDIYPALVELETEDLVAQVLHTKAGNVLACGGYLRPGIGVRGVNCTRMQKMAGVVGAWNGPWFVYCDWNVAPAELRASKWLKKLDAQILQPDDTAFTCTAGQQRLLDYVVHSADLESRLTLRCVPSPWLSHRGLELRLQTAVEVLCGHRLVTPASIFKPRAPGKAPDPWSKATRKKQARAAKEAAKRDQEAQGRDNYEEERRLQEESDWIQDAWDEVQDEYNGMMEDDSSDHEGDDDRGRIDMDGHEVSGGSNERPQQQPSGHSRATAAQREGGEHSNGAADDGSTHYICPSSIQAACCWAQATAWQNHEQQASTMRASALHGVAQLNPVASQVLGMRAAQWQRTAELYYHVAHSRDHAGQLGRADAGHGLSQWKQSRARGARVKHGPQPVRRRDLWSDGGASWWSTLRSLMGEWAICTRRMAQLPHHPDDATTWCKQRARTCADLLQWTSRGMPLGMWLSCLMPHGR